MPSDRHAAQDFLEFLDHFNEALYKDKVIHLIMDNLSAHKTAEVQHWFERHLCWTTHFTPTHGSWLNQVELWFGILSKALNPTFAQPICLAVISGRKGAVNH